MAEERARIWTPPGADRGATVEGQGGNVLIDNRSGLPDAVINEAVQAHFVENASVLGVRPDTFQTYANDGGSFLTRRRFTAPANVFDEIKLARDLAEKDDDCRATIGFMVAAAFGQGMENFSEDEQTLALFNQIAKNANLDRKFKEMYREYLIASSLTTVQLYTRERFEIEPEGSKAPIEKSVAAPLVGVIPAEQIRVLDSDIFETGTLAYVVEDEKLRRWLEEYFNPRTTPARKAEMGREDRVAAAMFTEQVSMDVMDESFVAGSSYVYKLNPRMVHRLSMPKDGKYPRPLLTANFALLEAKRLLNIMDYALLQGGANFIVVAKQGSDQRPAMQEEIDALRDAVRRASHTGVMVGDHRLDFEIVTPKLEELLNREKRALLGRKLANLLLRVPDSVDTAEGEGIKTWNEIVARVIEADRRDVKRHVEQNVYEETRKRNRAVFTKGPAKLWFPKIMLSGSQWFTDLVLKLRDRGDIPRKWAVEAGGFDYEAALAQRKQEIDRGDDEVLAPAAVPFSSPEMGPQDNPGGRPPGSSPNNGAPGATPGPGRDPAAPRRQITRNAGETVRAEWDEQAQTTVRVGEQTISIIEEYPDYTRGRLTRLEKAALEDTAPTVDGPLAIVPVNPGYETDEVYALRLTEGLSMLVGKRRGDQAIVAKALVFKEPHFSTLDAEERAMKWGFAVGSWAEPELDPSTGITISPEVIAAVKRIGGQVLPALLAAGGEG